MGIDTNFGPKSPVGPASGPGQQAETAFNPLLMSSLSPSQQEALMVLFLMNNPMLVPPTINHGTGHTPDVSAISSMVASKFAEIGSNMWDSYITYLNAEKDRIKEELQSPRYRNWLEQHYTPETRNVVPTANEYYEWVNSLPAGQREEELLRNHASNLWAHQIDGISNYVNNVHDSNPQAAAFMVASFVVSGAFIGNYLNIVDVASTNMVAVNPIQDAASTIMPFTPPSLQDSVALTINLFAIGAIYTSTAQLVPRVTGKETPQEMDFKLAKSYANDVVEKVNSNEINYYLMALLINSTEEGAPLTNQRLNQLAAMVKMIMLSVALAVLYKVEAGWIKGQDFHALVNGELQPRSDEETKVVDTFRQIRDSKVLSSQEWDGVIEALAGFFESNPKVEDILNPARVYAAVNSSLPTTEAKG